MGFVSLREGFDLATPAGRLMAGVLASVAAYETEVRKERQLAGIAKAKTEGKCWGGRKTGTRVRLTEEKEGVIRQLRCEGKGLLTLLDEFQTLGIGFVSLREGFDLATPAGRLMASVLASVAAYETEVRKERQLAGIAKAKENGKRWGGRKPGTRITVTEEKEKLVIQLHGEKKSVASISRLVGLSRKTVYQVLSKTA